MRLILKQQFTLSVAILSSNLFAPSRIPQMQITTKRNKEADAFNKDINLENIK